MECYSLPYELCELIARLAFVCLFLKIAGKLETPAGRDMLSAVGCLVGLLGTGLVILLQSTAWIGLATLLVGFADASIFILWLCFFGHMRVGETALYMALSYCVGGIVCLGVQLLGAETGSVLALLLPALSITAFYLSNKFYAEKADQAELFARLENEAGASENDVEQDSYLQRLCIALGLVALAFGLTLSSMFFGNVSSLLSGPLAESISCIILAIACGFIMLVTKQTQDLYVLYKIVPTVFVAGIVLCRFSNIHSSTVAATLTIFAYLMFEIAALNDFCTASKNRQLSLIGTFCVARAATTIGLILGWSVNTAANMADLPGLMALDLSVALAALCVVFASTVVFTAKEIFTARNVAANQERLERYEAALVSAEELFEQRLSMLATQYKLSARETEIAGQLLRGRTVNYIADQLFIAPGTVKTHMHKIYSKLNIHSKMELLDAFEEIKH